MRINKQPPTAAVPTYSGQEIGEAQRFVGRVFKLVYTPQEYCAAILGNVYMVANSSTGLVGINLATGRWLELKAEDRYQEHHAEVNIGEAK